MRTLKRYANGRLYDTANKKYVTKDRLAEWAAKGEKIKIVAAKTGKDVTKSVMSSLPTTKKAAAKGRKQPLWSKMAIKKRVDGHRKWIGKQVDKKMEAVLEMMNFPNRQQVVKLDADVRKLAKKIEDLQERHAQTRFKMALKHKKEMAALARQYEKRVRPADPAASNA